MTATDVRKRHRFLVKHGYRPMYYWERMRCSHYNKGGYKWRINSRGNIDRSCPHDDFDRWANSTEQTWTFEEFMNDHPTNRRPAGAGGVEDDAGRVWGVRMPRV